MKNNFLTFFFYVLVCTVVLILNGCTHKLNPEISGQLKHDLSIGEIENYFSRCLAGRSIKQIEEDLNLPEPIETEAPANDWPFWKFRYFKNDIVIYFWADGNGDYFGEDRHIRFWYIGNHHISTYQKYLQELSETN